MVSAGQTHLEMCIRHLQWMQPLYKPPCPPQEWSYLRGGLSTLDRDYGIINNIHHDIGTHVVRKIGKKNQHPLLMGLRWCRNSFLFSRQ